MADLVNDTGKRNLSVKNQEPTHLSMASHDDLGGTTIDAEPNSVKIDAAKGVGGRDTTVKGAGQLSEPTHLGGSNVAKEAADDVDVDFGESDVTADALDEALAAFEEVEIEVGDDKDDDKDDKKEVKEETGDGSEAERGENNGKMKSTVDATKAVVDQGPNKETGNNAVNEEDESELPPWLQKKKTVKEEEEIIIKDGGGEKKDDAKDDKGGDEKKPNPFAKKDDDKVKTESVKLKVDLPKATNLFESAGLSKASQTKVATLFESAIKDVTTQVSKQLHRHYKAVMESKVAAIKADMTAKTDSYLNYVVEEWMKTNKVNVRKSLRTQLAENFLDGLHKLFKEHYIDIPDSKVDVVEELTKQVTSLKQSLNEEHSKKVQLRELAMSANKARIVSDTIRTLKLSEAQVQKFMKLAEGVTYTSAKDFRGKLGVLQESFFGNNAEKGEKGKKTLTEQHLPEATVVVEEAGKPATSGDAAIDAIASAISRQAKSEKEWQN